VVSVVRAFGRVVRPLAWSGARPRRDARTGCAFLTSIAVLTGCTAPADDGDGDGESGESVQCESGGWNRGDGGSGDEGGEDTGLGMGDDMPLPLTIGELQQGLARDGDVVAITGVVAVTPSSSSEVLPGRELFVQDPAGGAWSGLRVVAQSFDPAQRLVPGDRAELVGPHEIRLVKSGRVVTAKTVLVAVGAAPHRASCPGSDLAITSNEIFHLPERPDHIVIVGAGYIALEFAAILRGLGSAVTVVHYAPEILRGFDRECAAHLHAELGKRGIAFVMDASVVGIREENGRREIGLSTGAVLEADQIMFATGRWPNTRGLGLETAGVAVNDKGAILVDAFSRTNMPHIYAVGDVTDRANLTPIAIREGHAFAETVFNANPTAVHHADIPTAIFTTPEYASVGLTEEQARHAHADVRGRGAHGRARSARRRPGIALEPSRRNVRGHRKGGRASRPDEPAAPQGRPARIASERGAGTRGAGPREQPGRERLLRPLQPGRRKRLMPVGSFGY
jgi:thioredoxin reductase